MRSPFLCLSFVILGSVLAARAENSVNDVLPSDEVRPSALAAAAEKAAVPAKRYPLRGVITAVYPDRAALMIKHEDIPGLMRAMTMLFKVDETTLKAAKLGQTITGMVVRQGDEWWLQEAKVGDAPVK